MYSIPAKKKATELHPANEMAIRRVFDLYYAPLCHYASKLIADVPAAQDIVTETFVKLWKLYDRFDGEESIRAFLFVAVRNACYNLLKKNRRETAHLAEWLAFVSQQEEQANNELLMAMVLQSIYAEIEQLPLQRRKICKLLFINGLNVTAVAERLNLSEQTVRNQKNRAVCQMRSRILKKLDHLPLKEMAVPHNN